MIGVPFLIVAGNCKTAELRHNNTSLCRLIRSDDAARKLDDAGWVLLAPFFIFVTVVVPYCVGYCCS